MAVYEVELEDGSVYEIETEELGNRPDTYRNRVSGYIEKADQDIAERPSQWQALKNLLTQTAEHPFKTLLDPTLFLKQNLALGEGIGRSIEAPIANTGLSLQRGRLSALQDLIGGISGNRPGELGDIMRSVGTPEPLAALTGMAGMAGVFGGANKVLSQSPVKTLTQAKGEMSAIGKGVSNISQKAIETIKNIPNKFFRGGLSKAEAIRVESEYGASNGSLIEQVKNKLNNVVSQAENLYKKAVNSFKGNAINTQEFYQTVQKGLREKGWVDLQGIPTSRYKSGLDPVMDKLTNMYLDMQNLPTNAGKKVIGQVISKEDFSTFRDALGAMLKEKPSDILVMQARNALYNSAEKSGMTGIKAARDLEKEAFRKSKLFLSNNGDLKVVTEAKLNKIGVGKISQQDLTHIEELGKYVKHPIVSDAGKINKLNNAKNLLLKRKEQLKGAAIGAGLTWMGIKGARKFTD